MDNNTVIGAKRRKTIVAALMSIVTPGLGQVYNGQLRKGISFFIAGYLLLLLFSLSGLQYQFYGIVVLMVLSISFGLFIIIDAVVIAKKIKEVVLRPYNKWYFYLIIAILMGVISSFTSDVINKEIMGIKAVKIPSAGMSSTIKTGDHIMINVKHFKVEKPERGDIVVFKYPEDGKKEFIKRVIGLPGETVEIREKMVYINGDALDESYAEHGDTMVYPAGIQPRDNFAPVIVPEDSYFVMGDNRDFSLDSRYWGFLESDKIIGKAIYVYWSWSREDKWIRWDRIGITIE